MKFKRTVVFAAGVAVGYVAGSAAGRERYEQILDAAHRAASETGLVAAKNQLGHTSNDVARTATDTVAHAARGVVESATDKVDQGLGKAQDKIETLGSSST